MRAQLWTLAASTHLHADMSGKNMPGISAAKHEHFNLAFFSGISETFSNYDTLT